jgi:hypothetical protein
MKILPFFASQFFDEFLPFVEGHGVHFGFDQGYPAALRLASFVCRVFFWIEVNEIGLRPSSSFLLGAVSGIMSLFTTGKAVERAPLSGIGYVSSSSPLTSCISSSSRSPVVLQSGSPYVHWHRGIAHRQQGI